MCQAFKRSQTIVLNYLEKQEFTFDDLKRYILEHGGSMRVAPNYTVREYLHDFELKGKIMYIPKTDQYKRV